MQEVRFNEYLEEFNNNLPGGILLTVKAEGKLNTMTIGWADIGIIWGKPIFTVLVRKSRYTYSLIENTDEFTVSIPFTDKLKDEIAFCGSHSGRDYDKIQECNFTINPGNKVSTPVINDCDLYYECRIIYSHMLDAEFLNPDIDQKYYGDNDYHKFYYGEIVSCYLADKKV